MKIAIIPARGGSKRFPRKNIALLNGKPLLYYAVAEARKSQKFDEIIVSTEDAEISAVAARCKAQVMGRSEVLASDDATVPMVCLDVISQLEKQGKQVETICILLPTSPLRKAQDIVGALDLFEKSGADYLMSTTDFHYSPFGAMVQDSQGYITRYFGNKYIQQDQKNPKVVVHDGSICICNVKQFKIDRTYYGKRIIAYRVPYDRAVDINKASDLKLAEYFMRGGHNN